MASGHSSSAGAETKDSNVKTTPRDARVMQAILKEMGIDDYEPRVINQMLEFTYRYVTDVLEDARVYCNHANKKEIDAEDIKLAVQIRMDHSFTTPPPRDFLMEIARQKNSTPLPLIQPRSGLRLPPDRYCLLSNNYRVKQQQKKQVVRASPIVPARPLPHFPLSTSSVGIKVNQPSVGVSSKPIPAAGSKPSTVTPRTTMIVTSINKPAAHATPVVSRPAGESVTVVTSKTRVVAASPSGPTAAASAKSSISSTQTAAKTSKSMSTVSALPSMDETVASSLQQQALVTSLKRKREGEDDDYDS